MPVPIHLAHCTSSTRLAQALNAAASPADRPTFGLAVNAALHDEMALRPEHDRVREDVAVPGGVFGRDPTWPSRSGRTTSRVDTSYFRGGDVSAQQSQQHPRSPSGRRDHVDGLPDGRAGPARHTQAVQRPLPQWWNERARHSSCGPSKVHARLRRRALHPQSLERCWPTSQTEGRAAVEPHDAYAMTSGPRSPTTVILIESAPLSTAGVIDQDQTSNRWGVPRLRGRLRSVDRDVDA